MEYVLMVQRMQALDRVAPTVVEYEPAKQAVQMNAPVPVEYVPAKQDRQAPDVSIPVPELYVPAKQAVHVTLPLEEQVPPPYCPTEHDGHSTMTAGVNVSTLKL